MEMVKTPSKSNTRIFTWKFIWKSKEMLLTLFQTLESSAHLLILNGHSASIGVMGELTNSLGSDLPAMMSNLVSKTARHLQERGN